MNAAVATYCEFGCPSCCACAVPSMTAAVKIGPVTDLAFTARSPSARIWFGDKAVDDGFGVEALVGVAVRVRLVFGSVAGVIGVGADVVVGDGGRVAAVVCVAIVASVELLLLVVPHPQITTAAMNMPIDEAAWRIRHEFGLWFAIAIGSPRFCAATYLVRARRGSIESACGHWHRAYV
jgi:hypothetical protein